MASAPHCTTHLPVEMKRSVAQRKFHSYNGTTLKSTRVEFRCPVVGCAVCAVVDEKYDLGKVRGTGRVFARDDFY